MAKKETNNYEVLEDQIGDLGETKSHVGEKLKHKSSYGQQEDLNPEEEKDLQGFLERSKKKPEPVEIQSGWIPLDRSTMGPRSIFYPEGWEFFIRPATIQSIKNWTAIDETKPDQLNRVFNEIVKTCVKIDTHDTTSANYQQINSWDRFWFILKIREYTFPTGESRVEFSDACSECGEDMTYTLNADSLIFDMPDQDLIDKYWDGNKWVIDPAEYGVITNSGQVHLYIPKIGKDEAIIEWATGKIRLNQEVDENFLKFLMWMLNKPSRDGNMLNRQINKLYKEYKDWDIDMFTFMDDVVTNLSVNPSDHLKAICPSCSREATSNVQFPNGIKNLFTIETNIKKFGSR